MSPILPDTPRALGPVRLEVEYPPWWQWLQWSMDGRIGPFSVSGEGNEFQGLRVSFTPHPNPPQWEPSASIGGVDSLAAGGRGELAACGFPHHRGRVTPELTGRAPLAMAAEGKFYPLGLAVAAFFRVKPKENGF